MTALPDIGPHPLTQAATRPRGPRLREAYWGYAIAPGEQIVGLAVLAQLAAGAAMVATFLAATGVWIVPASALSSDAVVTKMSATVMLICLGVLLARFGRRGTQVWLQVDTRAGELREVLPLLGGGEEVLNRIGMDCVTDVLVCVSSTVPGRGQLQIFLSDGQCIGAGDGGLDALTPVQRRIALDCGLVGGTAARPAIWAGPLAA